MNSINTVSPLRRVIAALTLASFTLTATAPVQANIMDDMDGLFKDVANAPKAIYKDTVGEAKNIKQEIKDQFSSPEEFAAMGKQGPSAIRGQTYTTFLGGSVYQKMPVKNIQLMSVETPRISAGCGGIDFYTGSISHLDGKKLVAFMKSVVMNMKGVIFQLGLETISPVISDVMKWAKKVADEINGMNLNSCNMAKGLVAGAGEAYTMIANNDCQNARRGVNKDAPGESQEQCQDSKAQDDTNKATRANPETKNLLSFKGNMTWEALKQAMCAGAVCGSNRKDEKNMVEEREMIMSMLGSWIYRESGEGRKTPSTEGGAVVPGKEKPAAPKGTDPVPEPAADSENAAAKNADSASQLSVDAEPEPLFPTILSMHDFLYGNAVATGATEADPAKPVMMMWTCGATPEEVEKCLDPVKKPVQIDGYIEKVRILWEGIATKMRDREILGPAEMDFINQTRLPVYQMTEMGTRNLGTGMDTLLIDLYKEVVATDYVMALVNRNVRSGQQALSNRFKWTPEQQRDLNSILLAAEESLKGLQTEFRDANARRGDINDTMQSMRQINEELVKHTPRAVMEKVGS